MFEYKTKKNYDFTIKIDEETINISIPLDTETLTKAIELSQNNVKTNNVSDIIEIAKLLLGKSYDKIKELDLADFTKLMEYIISEVLLKQYDKTQGINLNEYKKKFEIE